MVERVGNIIIGGYGFVTERRSQIRELLNLGKLRLLKVRFELRQLKFYFQVVAPADSVCPVLRSADVRGVLEAFKSCCARSSVDSASSTLKNSPSEPLRSSFAATPFLLTLSCKLVAVPILITRNTPQHSIS